MGTTIARHLASEGISVTVIDVDHQQVRRVDENYDVRGIQGHASHPATLQRAGARDADMLIAVTRSDEVNMVACQVAYSLFGVRRRIARLRHAGYLAHESSGFYTTDHLPIDIIISPEIEIAENIIWGLRAPGAFDRVLMAGGLVELLGIRIEELCPVRGVRVGDLVSKLQLDSLSILALVRNGSSIAAHEPLQIEPGDELYVLARTDEVKEVMRAFGHHEQAVKKLVVVGGGNVGLHLVQKLHRTSPHVNVKVIEQNRARAEYISNEIGAGVIVLHGDALDQSIIKEAQIGSADAIVAVTNDDESNIFASVLAKRAGCGRAITLINKRSYEALMPTLGIDTVVSPSAVTISTVLRYVRRGSIVALHTLREEFGEVMEAKITEESRLHHQPFGQLGLPLEVNIGAVVRDRQVFKPAADTQLSVGDHIIASVPYSHIHVIEELLGMKENRVA